MKIPRLERIARIMWRLAKNPFRSFSLSDIAKGFKVSKTVISDDIEIISKAMKDEGRCNIVIDRGRGGGAYLVPVFDESDRRNFLECLANELSKEERFLPGGLIYYSDIIFNPYYTQLLGWALASMFVDSGADVVMTTEVKGIPIALYVAQGLGLPLAVCRFRNRPSDGPAVALHYPSGTGEVRTMYMGTRNLKKGAKVLIIDDFMRGGSTISGMIMMTREFEASVVGKGVFIASALPEQKAISQYKALLVLEKREGKPHVSVL